MKVLLVEDEQSMLFTLSNLLKHRGYEVIAAESAEKGLEELGDDQVDLVISDLRLPGMDGISLIAEVRERCEDVVPIIISAYGTLGNAIDALKLSVCDFLRKPFDLSTFEETLSRAEQRRNQLLAYKKYVCDLKEAVAVCVQTCSRPNYVKWGTPSPSRPNSKGLRPFRRY
jgi:DNA-binding NtrC family response regulator